MKPRIIFFLSVLLAAALMVMSHRHNSNDSNQAYIRINLLGYKPAGVKVAVWCSKDPNTITDFQLVDKSSGKTVFKGKAGKPFGAYGPFAQTYRLDFSAFNMRGKFVLQAGGVTSPEFTIHEDVYNGAADFCLRYMRQQRSGFNPYLKDSCHTYDGYTMYGPMPDSTRIDVSGGWHDASDYLQYVTTSANAAYHLLAAYRDFPNVFSDRHAANGLEGRNGRADVLDEAKWGLDWLLKMHPRSDWMFNQLADDRDHRSMRIPKEDSFYGKGFERPVYFVTGEPQGLFKYKNRSTGTSSTAGKFSSAFSLGYTMFRPIDSAYAGVLSDKAHSAFKFGLKKCGVSQTAPGRAPYFYEEDNWSDDMELAAAALIPVADKTSSEKMDRYFQDLKAGKARPDQSAYFREYNALLYQYADSFSRMEQVTPWLGADTAKHYQWYPFINIGHYELAKQTQGPTRRRLTDYYKTGIRKVWEKAKNNAFYRGVPFIWCSNNLTTAFAIQCYWYRTMTSDASYVELEQANFDWLFGCNPWGTSFVYGLPSWGDTPVDPHSAFTHLKKYPIDGGLVDGPVYGSIYSKLIGITLHEPDEYAEFQSSLVVYHDDYGDYSTNEPTMDGTASLIYLLAAKEAEQSAAKKKVLTSHGAVIRGDTTKRTMALVFTGDEFAEGGEIIRKTLKQHKVKGSFFLTGRFYRNPSFKNIIERLQEDGHYLGAHSNDHLLYCDWTKRDSLLVTYDEFTRDLTLNYSVMVGEFSINPKDAPYFLPPYEWYNDSIVAWTRDMDLQLISYTPGTISHADYTTPAMKNYRSSEAIVHSIKSYESKRASGLNGFILLMHIGAGPERKDKLHNRLGEILTFLKTKGYEIVTLDKLLN